MGFWLLNETVEMERGRGGGGGGGGVGAHGLGWNGGCR